MASPPTKDFKELVRLAIPRILGLVEEGEGMLLKNRIFIDRLEGVGVISAADAIALSWTGPCLRASGVPYDVRKAHPYLKYDEVDFDVPIGKRGTTLDRFMVRLMEMRQSAKILLQCADRMADEGPGQLRRPALRAPAEGPRLHDDRGERIQHFKLIMEGHKIPKGEVYSYTEGGNGELGFYLVSDGDPERRIRRVRIRPPCFAVTAGLSYVLEGEHAERHRADVRLAEHDRRRVRSLDASCDCETVAESVVDSGA